MKKVLVLIAVVALSTSVFAQTGGNGGRKNVVKVNPLGLVFGSANVAYERAINEKNSVVLSPTFGFFNFGGFKYSSFGFGGEYRFYLSKSKTAPEGFYAAPGVGFTAGKVKEKGTSTEAKFTSFYGKAIVGNQWIFGSGFTLDLNAGINYSTFSYKDNNSSTFSGLKGNGIFPALGFSLGYAF